MNKLDIKYGVSYFAINGIHKNEDVFWFPVKSKSGKDLRVGVRVEAQTNARFVSHHVFVPVVAVDHSKSEDEDKFSVGYVRFLQRNFLCEDDTDSTTQEYLGMLPDIRLAEEGEIYLSPLTVCEYDSIPVSYYRRSHSIFGAVLKDLKIHTPWIENIRESMDQINSIGLITNSWDDIKGKLWSGELLLPFWCAPSMFEVSGDMAPREFIDWCNEHRKD